MRKMIGLMVVLAAPSVNAADVEKGAFAELKSNGGPLHKLLLAA